MYVVCTNWIGSSKYKFYTLESEQGVVLLTLIYFRKTFWTLLSVAVRLHAEPPPAIRGTPHFKLSTYHSSI